MTPVFLHGWGFDGSLWTALHDRLGGVVLDRGYFGEVARNLPSGPLLLIGHSLGSMLWLAALPPETRAMVAINGFDRFTAADNWPGVPGRVVTRMQSRFAEAPDEVLRSFRARCGTSHPPPIVHHKHLRDDLAFLAEGDCRTASAIFAGPVLVLQSDDDPLLPPALQRRLFDRLPACRRVSRADGGHLLPATQPDWCADQITSFRQALS